MVKDVLGGAYSILPPSENDLLNVHLPVGESEGVEDTDEVGQVEDEPETRFEVLNAVWRDTWNQEVWSRQKDTQKSSSSSIKDYTRHPKTPMRGCVQGSPEKTSPIPPNDEIVGSRPKRNDTKPAGALLHMGVRLQTDKHGHLTGCKACLVVCGNQ